MPILNLTPHTICLYSAADIQEARDAGALIFYRVASRETLGGFAAPTPTDLRCGYSSPASTPADMDEHPLSYREWPPEPVSALVSETMGPPLPLAYPDEEWIPGMPGGGGPVAVGMRVPVRDVEHGPITGLPAPTEGTYLIVSLPIIAAARAEKRTTDDLLTVGDLVRDERGNIAGCTSFFRWPSDGSTTRLSDDEERAVRDPAWQDRVLEAIRTGQP